MNLRIHHCCINVFIVVAATVVVLLFAFHGVWFRHVKALFFVFAEHCCLGTLLDFKIMGVFLLPFLPCSPRTEGKALMLDFNVIKELAIPHFKR